MCTKDLARRLSDSAHIAPPVVHGPLPSPNPPETSRQRPAAVHVQFKAATKAEVMRVPLTMLMSIAAYFVWISSFAEVSEGWTAFGP